MSAPLPPGYPPGSAMEVVSQLEGMGFSRELAEQAVVSTVSSQSSPSLQAALDWLLQLCQTPRQEPAAARAAESEEALHEQAREQLSPRTTEEEELARAIQMSLTVQSPAAMPGYNVPPGTLPAGMPPAVDVARQKSEEEELEEAIAASLADQREDTARAIEQLESYQTAEAERHSMLQRLPSPRAPTPPPIRQGRVETLREQTMCRALTTRAPQAMQIAKAALILRRRANSARLRVEERKLQGKATAPLPAHWPPGVAPPTVDVTITAPPAEQAAVALALAASAAEGEAEGSGERSGGGERGGEGEGEGEGEGLGEEHERRIAAGTKLLKERLSSLGLRRVATEDDGNCQFRALSQQLYGSEEFHGSVRREAVAHMRREADFFGAMFEAADFEAYLADMRRTKTWGDELTLRAVADALGCVVHVVTSNEANWYLQYVPAEEKLRAEKHVFLTYVAPVHYDALTLL